MLAFCAQCKARVSVVMVLANDIGRRDLAADKQVQVIHLAPNGSQHVWMVGRNELLDVAEPPNCANAVASIP